MTSHKEFSDELLNALVDEQLAVEDADRVYAHMHQDEALARRITDLRTVRDLVRLAYRAPARAPFGHTKPLRPTIRLHWKLAGALAAAIALVSAALLGPPWHERLITASPVDGGVSVHSRLGPERNAASATSAPVKVLIHLNTNDPQRIGETLDELENVLRFYRQTGQHARVEVVTNGEGLDLLRVGTSPFPQRVQRLLQGYDNLQFVACQNTIDRLKRERGITARLLPGVVVIDSGVAQIMRRQQEGWAYIRA